MLKKGRGSMKNKVQKMILHLLALVLSISFVGGVHAEETVITPRLVKTVTEYGIDFETNEWTPLRIWNFTYENEYPVSVDLYEIDADIHVVTSFSYVFENGVPTKRETHDSTGGLLSTAEYRNGCIYNVYEQSDIKNCSLFYQYGNGDEYFTLVLRDERSYYSEGADHVGYFAEEVDAVSVTVRSGLLVKTVNTGMYANWGGEEEKQWLRFSGTYTAEYDEDGIVAVTSAVHRVGPSGIENRYETTKEGGTVTEGIVFSPTSNGPWISQSRFTFEYSDIETTPSRYAQMINSFLMGPESSYYKYNWY